MSLEDIHVYWAEIAGAITGFAWLARLELNSRTNVRKMTERAEQEIREIRMKLEDHDAKLIYMQSESKTNSIQLTQILVEIQALKTGLEYFKEDMRRE